MTVTRKHRGNQYGTFILERFEENREFVCDRCLRPKVTRIIVRWTPTVGSPKAICNGCYGWLSAGKPL
jgi:hypothetical protein